MAIGGPREWSLVDTRNLGGQEFIVRSWVGCDGKSMRLREAPVRCGGAFGLFTTNSDGISVGRVAGGVDAGVGLLLCGLASLLAIPLPPHTREGLEANWLCIMSRSPSAFDDDDEIERLMLLAWVIVSGPMETDEVIEPSMKTGSRRAAWSASPAVVPMVG